jgi:hypothetical protein
MFVLYSMCDMELGSFVYIPSIKTICPVLLFAPLCSQPTSFNCIFPRYLHGTRCAHCPLFAPAPHPPPPISSSPYRKAFPPLLFLGGDKKVERGEGVKFIAALPVVTGNGKLKYNLDQMIITSFYTHGLFHPHPLLPPPCSPSHCPILLLYSSLLAFGYGLLAAYVERISYGR